MRVAVERRTLPPRRALRLRPGTRWVKIGAVISAVTALALAAALLAARSGAAPPHA